MGMWVQYRYKKHNSFSCIFNVNPLMLNVTFCTYSLNWRQSQYRLASCLSVELFTDCTTNWKILFSTVYLCIWHTVFPCAHVCSSKEKLSLTHDLTIPLFWKGRLTLQVLNKFAKFCDSLLWKTCQKLLLADLCMNMGAAEVVVQV